MLRRRSRLYADLMQGSWVMLPTNDLPSLSSLSDLPRFLLLSVLAAVDDLLGSGFLVSTFLYINWAYDAVDRRAIEGALARAPDEQREAVMSVLAQEREQRRIKGRAEGEAKGKAKTLLRLLERRFHGVPKPYHAQVLAADADQLDNWIDAVLDAGVSRPSLADRQHIDPSSRHRTPVRER
jgi:hypothetical protein